MTESSTSSTCSIARTVLEFSPAPWSYDYSPYTRSMAGREADPTVSDQIPAYEIFDADGNKVFDTNEDAPEAVQEANARLAAAAPQLLEAVRRCIVLLADYDQSDGEEGDIYRICLAAAHVATKGCSQPNDSPDESMTILNLNLPPA